MQEPDGRPMTKYLFLLAFLLILPACVVDHRSPDSSAWEQLPNHHAQCFRIARQGDNYRVTVFGPGGRSDTLGVYHISNAPSVERSTLVLHAPLQRIAVVSTTHLAFISALGHTEAVVAAAYLDQLRDSATLALPQGHVTEVGTATGLDREMLIMLNPDALFDYPFGKSDRALSNENGPVGIAVTEYLEEHPLGRAEWLRFFGVFLGEMALADSLYLAIAERYERIAANSATLGSRPKVFFGSAWQGNWFAPPGNSYMAGLITDAGGEYLFADQQQGANITMDLETVLDRAGRADHFGMVLAVEGKVQLDDLSGGDPRLASLRAISVGGFHGNSAQSDLFGRALIEPDVVLRDLQCIFFPAQCDTPAPVYFRALDQ